MLQLRNPLRTLMEALPPSPVFRLLMVGETLSMLGSGLVMGVFTFWFYDLTGSTLAVGTYSLLLLGIRIFVAPAAGIYVDRLDRRWVLLGANLTMAGMALVPLLVHHPRHIGLAYLGAGLLSAAQAFFRPAWQASLPNLVGPEGLPAANALYSMGQNLAFMMGPLAGGVMAQAWGFAAAFVGNSLSYLAAAAAVAAAWRLWPVTRPVKPATGVQPAAPPRRRAMGELREGLAFTLHHPLLRSLLLAEFAFALGIGAMNALFIPFMADILHSDAVGFGGVMVAQGIGGLLVAGYIGTRARGSRHPHWVVAGVGYLAVSTFLYTAFPIYGLMVIVVALEGVFVEGMMVVAQVWWQELTPDALRGRAFSLRDMAEKGGQAISMLVGSTAAHLLGLRAVFFGIAGVLALGTLAALAFAAQVRDQGSTDTEMPAS